VIERVTVEVYKRSVKTISGWWSRDRWPSAERNHGDRLPSESLLWWQLNNAVALASESMKALHCGDSIPAFPASLVVLRCCWVDISGYMSPKKPENG